MKHITKNLGGRPPKYPTPELLQAAVDKYFEGINGGQPTISGMCLHINLTRQGFAEYEAKSPGFSDVTRNAKLRIATMVESDLLGGKKNPTGMIFWLKSQEGWRDGREYDGGGKQLNITGNTIVLLPGSLDNLHQEQVVLDAVYEQASLTSGQKDPEEDADGPA